MNEKLQPQNNEIRENDLIYSINIETKTASVIRGKPVKGKVIIPRIIKHKLTEYVVTRISKQAFYRSLELKSVKFSNDSELQIIEKEAFAFSTIENISIPASLKKICDGAFFNCRNFRYFEIPKGSKSLTIEKNAFYNSKIERISISSCLVDFKEGWCFGTGCLNEIIVDENNPIYSVYEDKFIVGKSEASKEKFDTLVFCIRNIQNVTIPAFIEIIKSFSFDNCQKIREITIPDDSKLRIIEKEAFSYSSIETFSLPPQITSISEFCFYECDKLEEIKITKDSKLTTIGEKAFFGTKIKSIWFPSSLTKLEEGWCCLMKNLNEVKIDRNNQIYSVYEDKFIVGKSDASKENHDIFVCAYKNIRNVTIPAYIETIAAYSFEYCKKLRKITIPDDSKLRTIGKYAFNLSTLKKFTVPNSLLIIGEGAFSNCKLRQIEIQAQSKLEKIDLFAFYQCSFENISIPPHLTFIGKNSFYGCSELQRIEIPTNSEIKHIGDYAFADSSITSFKVPASITSIGKNTFDDCCQLQIVEFDGNIEVDCINEMTDIDSPQTIIMIPPKIMNK